MTIRKIDESRCSCDICRKCLTTKLKLTMTPLFDETFNHKNHAKIKLETKILYSYTHTSNTLLTEHSIKYSFVSFFCSASKFSNDVEICILVAKSIYRENGLILSSSMVKVNVWAIWRRVSFIYPTTDEHVCVEKLFIVTARSIVDWILNWMSLLNSRSVYSLFVFSCAQENSNIIQIHDSIRATSTVSFGNTRQIQNSHCESFLSSDQYEIFWINRI